MNMDIDQDAALLAENGRALFADRKYAQAAESFAAAAGSYAVLQDELMAAEMKNNECVALLQAKKLEEALKAVSGTDEIFARAGDLRRQGMALANRASVLDALKQWDDAIAMYEQAAAVLEDAGENDLRADVKRSLAALHVRRRKGIDAVIAMQDGLRKIEKPTLKQRILKRLLRFHLW